MKQIPSLPHLLHQRLQADAKLFEALTAHPTLVGSGRENALTELLRQFMPRRFEILSGTIARMTPDHQPLRSMNQLDVIVADTNDFPTLLRLGNVAVVLSESVRAVIEVKSDLERGQKFIAAIVQIARARQLLWTAGSVLTGLYSFGAPTKPETLRDWLEDIFALRSFIQTKRGEPRIEKLYAALLEGDAPVAADDQDLLAVLANDNLPEIVVADRGALARLGRGEANEKSYAFLKCKDEPSVIALVDALIERLGIAAGGAQDGALTTLRAHLAIEVVDDEALEDLKLPPDAVTAPQ